MRRLMRSFARLRRNGVRETTQKSILAAFEPLEPKNLLAGLVISEFLASNDNGIRDVDRNRPDWIELLNTSDEEVSLEGWFLTDDEDNLDRWEFPDVRLAANERMVVFASEKNRRDPNGELHTNFRLGAEADYLALVEPDGVTVAFDFGSRFLPQLKDVSFGLPQAVNQLRVIDPGAAAKLLVPTTANGGDALGTTWATAAFDDAGWTDVTTGIGYERNDGYQDLFQTDVGAAMFDINTSAYLRMPFNLDDPDAVFSIELDMQYDDGYVAYINGQEIARKNAPDDVQWNSEATDAHSDRFAVVPERVEIDATQFSNLFQLGKNVLAIHTLNDDIQSSDFLIIPALTLYSAESLQADDRHYFSVPTPGSPNGLGWSPTIVRAEHEPRVPQFEDDLHVKAQVVSTSPGATEVTLHYRVMFEAETSVPMFDDGQHNDGPAGDGVYGATVPAGVAAPGQMIRYRITASGADDSEARLPVFADPANTEQYFGTVVHDPTIQSNLEVFHVFVEDAAASETQNGSSGALFHEGNFYDNVFVDTTGRTIGLSGPKKSHDIFFSSDHWFQFDDLQLRMNDFDVINDFWNRAKVRIPLGFETFRKIGSPAHLSMPVRLQRNGEFHATYSFVDGGNEQFLARAGLNPTGALYKMNLRCRSGSPTR